LTQKRTCYIGTKCSGHGNEFYSRLSSSVAYFILFKCYALFLSEFARAEIENEKRRVLPTSFRKLVNLPILQIYVTHVRYSSVITTLRTFSQKFSNIDFIFLLL